MVLPAYILPGLRLRAGGSTGKVRSLGYCMSKFPWLHHHYLCDHYLVLGSREAFAIVYLIPLNILYITSLGFEDLRTKK